MYHRILITQRTDCALELIRACHRLGIEAFVTMARDDINENIINSADGVVTTGFSRDAYTNQDDILEAAKHLECEAILTGWGFLSEDTQFARKCRLLGIDFVGPSNRQLQVFGDKLKTIRLLSDAFHKPHPAIACNEPDCLNQIKNTMTAPYMLKPRFGGGGKNIRFIQSFDDLCDALESLKEQHQEFYYFVEPAISGNSNIHLEFQFMGDGRHTDLIGARDCSPQFRHQKWLERSICLRSRPDIVRLGFELRDRISPLMGWATVECLVESDGSTHLLEVNPRLQVEHGVTELDLGYNIITNALKCSCEHRIDPFEHWDQGTNDTLEFRLYARSTGTISNIKLNTPPENSSSVFRIECGYSQRMRISGIYDGMVARCIVKDRCGNALETLKNWASDFVLEGVEHNIRDLLDFRGFADIPQLH